MAAEIEIIGTFRDDASGGLSGFAGTLGNLGNIVTGIKSAFDLVGMAIDSAVGFISPFIDSASESEQAVARLEGVLSATGSAAGLTSAQLQEMANSLQETTRFSDETILAGESILLTFRNIGAEMFERTVPAMVDMAEIFGSVDSAAMQLGKALNDPIAGMGALSRAGITFSDEQKEMIKNFVEMGDVASAQNIILSEVEAQVGGLAEKMGTTFSGQWAIFQNQLDGVKESIGNVFLPVFSELIGKFTEFMDTPAIQSIIGFFDDLGRYLGTGVEPLAAIGYSLNNMSPALHDIAIYFLQLQDIFRNGGSFGDMISKVFGDIDFGGLMQTIADKVTGLDWTGFSQAVAKAISSIDWGKVGNIIAEGLGQLVVVVGTILEKIDWNAVLSSIGNAIADLIAGLFGFIDWEDMWASALVGFSYIGNQIKNFFVGLWNDISDWWSGIDWGDIGMSIVNGLVSVFRVTPIGQITFWFADIIQKVKDIFGISSPSSVFYNIAHDIIQGLINGWNAFWGDLVDIATQSLDDFLNMFGIDLSLGGSSASGLGSAGGGTAPGGGTGTGDTSTGGGTTINIYGTSYWGVNGPDGVDCVSPNPLVAASGNQLVVPGF